MFKSLCLAAALVTSIALTGCAASGGATPAAPTQAQIAAFAAATQTKIAASCTAFQPTLSSVAAILVTVPAVAAVSDGVGLACAANSTLNTTNLSSLINTSLPTAITDVNNSSLPNKTVIVAGLMVLQSSLSVALAEYNLSVATGTSVSLSSAVAPTVSVKLVPAAQ
jgi:uncharacterized membrane protein YkvI